MALTLQQLSDRIEIQDSDLAQIVPTEYRADLVLLLRRDTPVFGIVVEVQLAADPDKRFSWPLYASGLRARLRCPACVLVVTPDARDRLRGRLVLLSLRLRDDAPAASAVRAVDDRAFGAVHDRAGARHAAVEDLRLRRAHVPVEPDQLDRAALAVRRELVGDLRSRRVSGSHQPAG